MSSPRISPKAPKIASLQSEPGAQAAPNFTSSNHSSPNSTPTLTPRIPTSTLGPTGAITTSLGIPLHRGRGAGSTGTLSTITFDDDDPSSTATGTEILSSSAPVARVISDPTTGVRTIDRSAVIANTGSGSEGSRTPHSTYVTGKFEDFLDESSDGGRLGASLGRRRRAVSGASASRSRSPPSTSTSKSRSASKEKPSKDSPAKATKNLSPLNTSELAVYEQDRLKDSHTPKDAAPSTWWGRSLAEEDGEADDEETSTQSPYDFAYRHRSWKRKVGGKEKIGKEHKGDLKEGSGWKRTRDRVAKATASIMDSTGAAVVHELLDLGSELAELAPIPGLQPAAKLLLNLWDALEGVDDNRQACLRLIEHCAEILLSIREDIHEVGEDIIGKELESPLQKLTGAFLQIQELLASLTRRPFLKRYLKRDEIRIEIELCEKSLNIAIQLFSSGIQTRILRSVLQGLEVQRGKAKDVEQPGVLVNDVNHGQSGPFKQRTLDPLVEVVKEDLSASQLTTTSLAKPVDSSLPSAEENADTPKAQAKPLDTSGDVIVTNTTTTSVPNRDTLAEPDPSSLSPLLNDIILSAIRTDSRDLAALLKQTLATGRDEELVQVMQVSRDEMLEAIVALRRESERWDERRREIEDEIKRQREELEQLKRVQGMVDSGVQASPKPVLGRTLSAVSKLSRRSTGGGGTSKPRRTTPDQTSYPHQLSDRPLPNRRTSSSSTARPAIPQPSPSRRLTDLPNITPPRSGVGRRQSDSSSQNSSGKRVPLNSGSWVNLNPQDVEKALRRGAEEEEMATLHREFIEEGIEALRRLSRQQEDTGRKGSKTHKGGKRREQNLGRGRGSVRNTERAQVLDHDVDGAGVAGLPSWTITRYDIDRQKKIGIGFFSDVYKGTWRPPYPITPSMHTASSSVVQPSSRPSSSSSTTQSTSSDTPPKQTLIVAIKVLSSVTPRTLFLREAKIWKSLPAHPNVLELYGASSTTSDPPWFFVCPYLKEGSLVGYLHRLSDGEPMSLNNQSAQTDALGLLFSQNPTIESLTTNGEWPLISPNLLQNIQRQSPSDTVTGVSGSSSRSPPRGPHLLTYGASLKRELDLHRFMLEIATGMAHLHHHKIYHGDLKAANILVDDQLRCVISDFGQSEMKSEAYRLSGVTRPHGTLRWQAPELLSGASPFGSTAEMDVYAYAICCVEILNMGRLPWPKSDDNTVRNFVLNDNLRPPLPNNEFVTAELRALLSRSWHRTPTERPAFAEIIRDMTLIRKAFRHEVKARSGVASDDPDTPSRITSPLPIGRPSLSPEGVNAPLHNPRPSRPSPDMRPIPSLPDLQAERFDHEVSGLSPASIPTTDDSYHTAGSKSPLPSINADSGKLTLRESTVASDIRMPIPVYFTPVQPSSSSSSSTSTSPSVDLTKNDLHTSVHHPIPESVRLPRPESPSPTDDRAIMTRDERRYRLLLNHEHHPSLTLPLWDPSPVELGAVGYLSKPLGAFITLFNSFHPERCEEEQTRGLPSLRGYGKVPKNSLRTDKRNSALRGLDAIVGWLTFRTRGHDGVQKVSRRQPFNLRSGKKAAFLYAETTVYRYMEQLEVPKKWFKANIDAVLQIYEPLHHIQREDIILVIGTLDTPAYGLFVSHSHPDGQVNFNVYSNPRIGHPWGTWTTDRRIPSALGGPTYNESIDEKTRESSKVSNAGDPWNTVLVARLRFKPDIADPTSM